MLAFVKENKLQFQFILLCSLHENINQLFDDFVVHNSRPGDGKTYANKRQTKFEERFDDDLQIKGVPKIEGQDIDIEELTELL